MRRRSWRNRHCRCALALGADQQAPLASGRSRDGVHGRLTAAAGELTVYKNDPTLVMFTSGPEVSDSEGTAVFIGGLTDGPMSLCYLPALAAALEEKRWRLCQPTLSSAYLGFGVSDLDKDAE